MTVSRASLEALARAYLDRQPWFQMTSGAAAPREIDLVYDEALPAEGVQLARLVLFCRGRRYSLFAGWRPASKVSEVLHGREAAIFGSASTDGAPVLVYDALADDELAIALCAHASGGQVRARLVRQLVTLASHASLVYDETALMKCYRVLEEGTRPEIELLEGLDRVGFNAMPAPIGVWQSDGLDLALVREFMPTALEGRLLALTSLRDLLARATGHDVRSTLRRGEADFDPEVVAASAGGDLASEMRRLGQMAGSLHLCMAAAFGSRPLSPGELAAALGPFEGVATEIPDELRWGLEALADEQAGEEIRLHGDFHLRRVMRSEPGWVLAGFGDDPLYADPGALTSIPAQRGSPAEDVADMLFSINRIANEALAQRTAAETELASGLVAAWVRRNQAAFMSGYEETPRIETIAPLSVLRPLATALALERQRDYEATLSLV